MHPSTALATVVVDELLRGGVTDVVLAPGSRSAPLAYALAEAHGRSSVRLHVRIDERSAGFLALGLARASGRPVPVVTTSGTAVANLHPAVLEAHHSGVPLMVVSADRPAELRGTGANQTTVQPGIFAGAVRWEADVPAPESVGDAAAASWRATVCRALAGAQGYPEPWASGPVHLNVSFRDPLAPDLADTSAAPAGRAAGKPWTVLGPTRSTEGGEVAPGERTVVLLGDLPDPELARQTVQWARSAGWPVLAEPFGVLASGPNVVPHAVLVAGRVAAGGADHPLHPDRVIVVGRLTLFREFGALLRGPGVEVEHVCATSRWTDPSHVVRLVHGVGVLGRAPSPPMQPAGEHQDSPAPGASGWANSWVQAGAGSSALVAQVARSLSGVGVARAVAASLGEEDLLVLGSSNAPRDLALAMDGSAAPARVLAGRGLAGIDGTVSTAIGAALTGPRTVALMGDLTFLHDAGGLVIGPAEPVPDLTIVVANDDGGGIFSTLEYGDPTRSATPTLAGVTERIFGTPHGTDLAALCAAHHVSHQAVTSIEQLSEALSSPARGIRVLEVPVERASHRRIRDALR